MSGENTSAKWWQTLPGILTAITAIITAVAGLIAVLHQTGLLPSFAQKQPPTVIVRPLSEPPQTSALAATTATAGLPATAAVSSLILPASTQVKLPVGDGNIVYTLLTAQLEAYNTENRSLTLKIRAFNDYSYSVNFWDRSFRLLVDGIAQAPANSLNEVLAAQSAKEGSIVFVIPLSAQQVIVKIGDPGQASTQIPLDLSNTKPES